MSKNKTNFFRASAEDFKKIPGSPVAYWVSEAVVACFGRFDRISDYARSSVGLQTGDNDKFIRMWWEVVFGNIKFDAVTSQDSYQAKRYFPYNKGGVFRKWHGNNECVVVWRNNGEEIIRNAAETGHHWQQYAEELKFQPMVTWSRISSGDAAFRYKPHGYMSDMAGFSIYPKRSDDLMLILGYSNSNSCREFLKFMSPTLNFMLGQVISLPLCYSEMIREMACNVVSRILRISVDDYSCGETSWDFTVNPLVAARNVSGTSDKSAFQLSALYAAVRATWAKDCEEMRRLETENNRIFIEAYGLQDELTPDVPWHEITLTCNPWYRYGVKVDSGQCAVGSAASDHCTLPTDNLLEERLKGDTVKELISYAVGCMMGRYSLEKPGLILADQGAQISDQWIVVSGQLVLRGKVAECVRKELQRIDCLAEGDGSCGRSVSTGETAPDGGTVCIVGSASSGGGFNSVECRRGAGAEYDAGLHELSDNGTRVVLRDGNTIVDLCSAEVLDAIASGSGAELVRRGWKDAERIDWKTIHSSLTTSHFSPDEDGIIPILDNDWFADDIVTRFKEFVKVAFGESHFFENMAWIEEALGKNLRDYFTKDFYKDHLQRYQNRPIYWLFQSPKGAFRALVYMHRYKPDMVGGVLGYLRSLQTKVENQLGVATQIASDESKSSTERVRANKEVVKYSKMQKELDEYEKNVLYPLSTERIEIDLDDGVKVNYRKFGVALRKVAALEGKGE